MTILSLTVPDPKDNTSVTITTDIIGEGTAIDDVCSNKAKDNLEKIFQFLHSKLLDGFEYNLQGLEQFGATYDGHSFDEIVSMDNSSLFRCLYALATGETVRKIEKGNLWDNQKASVSGGPGRLAF